MTVQAVLFDLDGVLIDSEQAWDEARRRLVAEAGGTWRPEATRAMMGMSSHEWSAYLRQTLGVPMDPAAISDAVVALLSDVYRAQLPLIPGAVEAVTRIGDAFPIALASSSNRAIIDLVLDRMGITDRFGATVSSEEVPRGKPAPDVYLAAARAIGVDPAACVAVEDSENGIRSAHASGAAVLAMPNPHFAPDPSVLALASGLLGTLADLTPEAVMDAGAAART